jgi:hypothetical protein
MVDYMHHLRGIIADTDPTQTTPNVARCDTGPDFLRKKIETRNKKIEKTGYWKRLWASAIGRP